MSVKLRSRKLKNGGESYYLDIYHRGQRRYESLDFYKGKDDFIKFYQKYERFFIASNITDF